MEVLAGFGVDLVNVHAAGGKTMMEAALEGLDKGTPSGLSRPSIIGVTQLTSTDERQVREEQLIGVSLQESVLHYAKLTKKQDLTVSFVLSMKQQRFRKLAGKSFSK